MEAIRTCPKGERFAVTVFLTVALASATFASADVKERRPPVFDSQVSLVQVPVFVSGKSGAAERGLGVGDFRVEEDGKPVKVVSFRFVDTTSEDRQEAIGETSAARRRFLLLFDKSFTDPAGLARARRYASEFVLGDLVESDLVGVATFDFHRGIRLIANFTEDRRVVEHAIYTLGVSSLTRISDPLAMAVDSPQGGVFGGQSFAAIDTPAALVADLAGVLAGQGRSAEESAYRARVASLLDSFELLGHCLRRIEGRKQIVYFSTGFSDAMLAGQGNADQFKASEAVIRGDLSEVNGDARFGDPQLRGLVRDALKRLSQADAVVHTIDVGGLGYQEDYSQARGGATSGVAAGRDSLALIADETGGRFYRNANNLRPALRELSDLTSRYYVLGVQPRENGKHDVFRKLRVRVSAKGLRVSHRPGFFDRTAEGQAADAEAPLLERQFEAAELLWARDGTGDHSLPFGVLIVPVPSDEEGQSLGIVVQIPRASLTKAGPLEVYGYAVSDSGEVLDHFAHFLRLESAAAQVGNVGEWQGVSFAGRFVIPAGAYTVRFLVQRVETGESGVRVFDVTVPRRQPSRGFLLPPVFLGHSAGWSEVALKSGDLSGLPLDMRLGSETRFLPRTDVDVRAGRRERVLLVAYDPDTTRDPAIDVDIRTTLSDDSGKRYPVGSVLVDEVVRSEDGRRSYLLDLMPESVPPGEYILEVQIGEAGSVLRSHCRLTMLGGESVASR